MFCSYTICCRQALGSWFRATAGTMGIMCWGPLSISWSVPSQNILGKQQSRNNTATVNGRTCMFTKKLSDIQWCSHQHKCLTLCKLASVRNILVQLLQCSHIIKARHCWGNFMLYIHISYMYTWCIRTSNQSIWVYSWIIRCFLD